MCTSCKHLKLQKPTEDQLEEYFPKAERTTKKQVKRKKSLHTLSREEKRVQEHCYRASRAGLPATLTLDQWINTLNFFELKCAYCQVRKYELLEHFIPFSIGGGTTVNNCVPACKRCNIIKGKWHPLELLHLSTTSEGTRQIQSAIERVQQYLIDRESEVVA